MTTAVTTAYTNVTGEPVPAAFKKTRKRVKRVAVFEQPEAELLRLVKQHKNWMTAQQRLKSMTTDRKFKDTNEIVKCQLPDDTKTDLKLAGDRLKKHAKSFETDMKRQLKNVPIYEHFLSEVYGMQTGPVTTAYLCAMIKIDRSIKSSALRRYCGYAVNMEGRLERREGGPKYGPKGERTNGTGTFNSDIRRALYLAFGSMWKNRAKKTTDAPHGVTSKYLEIWKNARHRELMKGSPRGKAFKKGMHKAIDVFIEDLYIIWRTLDGREVWPSYYAAKLGYEHGGKISVNEPRFLTLEQAKELVGYVGAQPLTSPEVTEVDDSEEIGTDDNDD